MKWMYYDETKCADKWDPALNNEVLKDNVTSYLRSKGIKVYDIEIFNMGTPESCSECACKTGRQFKVKVKRSDKRDIQAEGFHE